MIYVCTCDISSDDSKQAIIDGKDLITNITDLYTIIAERDCTQLELKKDFVNAYFTTDSILELVNDIKLFNPRINIVTEIDYWDKTEKHYRTIEMLNDKEDFINWVLANKTDAFTLYKNLVQEHNDESSEQVRANSKLNSLSFKYKELEDSYKRNLAQTSHLKDYLEILNAKHNTLVTKINMNYNVGIDVNYLEGIDVEINTFNRILYIKEITRVTYVDTFIYYLQEVLKTIYTEPSRLLVIEAPFAYNRSYLYPTCKNHLDVSVGDIYKGNIFCAGYQNNVVTDILKNAAHYKYLIVLDRSGWKKPFIRGKNVENYYTVSDFKDFKGMTPLDRIISYNKNSLHVNHIKDFEEMTTQERIQAYSSMEIMVKTISLLEGVIPNEA